MGCDIHVYIEIKQNNKWEYSQEYIDDIDYENQYIPRNYSLFALLAKVRGTHKESLDPRGLPKDVSSIVKKEYIKWNGDGHTHSYISLNELKILLVNIGLLSDNDNDIKYAVKGVKDLLNKFDESRGTEQRAVFWFDN